jgi:hypothetical protein
VFGRKKLEWSCFCGSVAAWSSPKHALYFVLKKKKWHEISIFTSSPPLLSSLLRASILVHVSGSHRSSYAMRRKIFDDVEESERGERKMLLLRETTTS